MVVEVVPGSGSVGGLAVPGIARILAHCGLAAASKNFAPSRLAQGKNSGCRAPSAIGQSPPRQKSHSTRLAAAAATAVAATAARCRLFFFGGRGEILIYH